ncbi:MAG: endolytic transglycosylase MltG [Bulleidia sp.]
MAKNRTDIDLDELDELPDVVLGEETRALRIQREGSYDESLINPEEPEIRPIQNQSDDFQFTRSLDAKRIAEEAAKLDAQQRDETAKTEIVPPVLSRTDRKKKKAAAEKTEVIPVKKPKPVKAEETQIIDRDEIAEEVPPSIIDDDPGIEDELAKLFVQDEPEEDGTTAVPQPDVHTETQKTVTKKAEFDETKQTTSQLVYEEPEEETRPKKRKRRINVVHTIVVTLLCVLLVLLGLSCYSIYQSFQPVSANGTTVPFTVNEGETMSEICERLEEAGVIRNDQVAYLYARIRKYNNYTAGNHTFSTDMTLDQVFAELETPTMADNVARVTVIEGDWAKDIASRYAEVTNVSADELLALWNNADWIRSQMDAYPFLTEDMINDSVRIYLEGYLAPDTYEIYKETTAEDITKRMLDQSLVIYDQYKDDIAASGHSIHEIYTMASIIQYEAGTNPDDLAKVASVFYNRLAAGMPLGSSVTVCYAIDFDRQTDGWQACEMNSDFDSPYNTYLNGGLPPGAIENAGAAAIQAAIYPADTDYYYFMADVCGDGTVHYAETLEEHDANVNTYLSDISNGCN